MKEKASTFMYKERAGSTNGRGNLPVRKYLHCFLQNRM